MKTKCALCGKRKRSFEAHDYYCGRCDKIAGDVMAGYRQEIGTMTYTILWHPQARTVTERFCR